MERNQSHKSGVNSNFYYVAIKGFLLSSPIFIWTSHVCFAVKKMPYTTSMYFYVSINETSIKSEIYGVMWQVAAESKIQLFSCELSPKYLLGISEL